MTKKIWKIVSWSYHKEKEENKLFEPFQACVATWNFGPNSLLAGEPQKILKWPVTGPSGCELISNHF
jgi:hypothetical protein